MKNTIVLAICFFAYGCVLGQYVSDETPRAATDLFLLPSATRSSQQPWNISALLYEQYATKAYDAQKQRVPLAPFIYKADLTIGDIYLAARLAQEHTIQGTTPGAQQQIEALAELAPIMLDFTLKHKEVGIEMRGSYRFTIPQTYILTTLGFMIPFRRMRHFQHLRFAHVAPSQSSKLYKFFIEEILIPKNITFVPYMQQKGLGDILGYMGFDFHNYVPTYFLTSEIGLIITFPTSSRLTGIPLWEIELGTGGSYQYDLYLNLIGKTKRWWLNPSFAATLRMSPYFFSKERVVQYKNSLDEIILPSGLDRSSVIARSFFAPDSNTYYFADRVWCTQYKYGFTGFFIIGNTFKNIGTSKLLLNVYYQFFGKRGDILQVLDVPHPAFNITATTVSTLQQYHALIVSLTYKPTETIECTIGDQEIIGGKNSYIFHKFFVGLSASW